MRLLSLFFCALLFPVTLFGAYTYTNGNWSPEKFAPKHSVQEHYDLGLQEFQKKNWDNALINFMVINYHYQKSPFYQDALFYAACSIYFEGDLEVSNKYFDRYLESGGKLKHFEKVFEYKLQIANHYAHGSKRHLFGLEKFPRWAPAKKDSIALYDEIIAALPGKEIAAQALYNKADLSRARRQYREAIDALQLLTRRFPRHSLSADSFVTISEIYVEQSRVESQNPDLIALAQVNLQRFYKSFPSDMRVDTAKSNLIMMQEVYAQSLYDTGRFYERKKKPDASTIYYVDTIRRYPGTQAAAKSQERLAKLGAAVSNRA